MVYPILFCIVGDRKMSKSILVKLQLNNLSLLLEDNINERIERATEVLTPIIADDLHPYLPYKTGKLDKSVVPLPQMHMIQINAEYAGYALYPLRPDGYPKEYNKKFHPKASGTPVKDAQKELGDKWIKIFEEEVQKGV